MLAQLEDLLDREIRRDAESQVEIGDTGNQLSFAAGNRSLFSRKLTGTFPNWGYGFAEISRFHGGDQHRRFPAALCRGLL